MILAAGRGERLRPLTDTMPKPLVEIGGSSLIERYLERLAAASVHTVVINLGWLGERIAERVGSGRQYDLQVVYSPEYDRILDTGGGIHRALPVIGAEPFWVLNADVFTDMPLPSIELAANSLGHLVLVPTPDYKAVSDFVLHNGMIGNGDANDPPDLTYSGMAFYRPELFAGCKAGVFSVVPLMRAAADGGRLEGSLYEGVWEDVGTAERLQSLQAKYR